MPRLSQTVEATTELELRPEVRATLEREFVLYENLSEQIDDTTRDRALVKTIIDEIRLELGVKSVGFDGFHCTDVSGGTTRTLDLKQLCKDFKITPRTLATYYKEKPKKGYTLITTPKAEARAAAAKAAKAAAKGAGVQRDERDDYDEREED